jgi:putative oxygen-independent coproporphyrinogen III oxidase
MAPPLALYVHVPWCLRKCPYCDFNSHALSQAPPFDRYVTALLEDLDQDLSSISPRRPLGSVFIGGGTPSLMPGPAARRLLDGIRDRIEFAPDCEITLEANPGAADAGRFEAYRTAGVNRLSIGVQSLSATHLSRLGRIHDPVEARSALLMARAAGFENVNLDLMFALPGQTLAEAAEDLNEALALAPEHLSYYQLTLEPETPFYIHPPEVPDSDLAAEMGEQGGERLAAAGYGRYEVSAYARGGRRCRHNLNYWRFGDYLGIGAGAHAKLTEARTGEGGWLIRRTAKHRSPAVYLRQSADVLVYERRVLSPADALFELALNGLRLTEGFERDLIPATTGQPWSAFAAKAQSAEREGLLSLDGQKVRPTALGRAFLDDLVARFMPEKSTHTG